MFLVALYLHRTLLPTEMEATFIYSSTACLSSLPECYRAGHPVKSVFRIPCEHGCKSH